MSLNDIFVHFNALFAAILRSPAHWLLSPGLALITVTGRRSGRQYTIPVGYQRYEDQVVVLVSQAASKQWWRNYLDGGPATLHLKGKSISGRGQTLTPGSEEFLSCTERTLKRLPWLAGQFCIERMGRDGLTEEQAQKLTATIAVVRIDLKETT